MRLRMMVIVLIVLYTLVTPLAKESPQSPVVAQAENVLHLQGLVAPATLIYDAFGVPHLYAENVHDLFMAQGFVEAKDRFWQMEWWRHLSAGRAAELAGTAMVNTDIYLRTLNFSGAAALDLTMLSPEAISILEAYAEGVNAYLAGKTPGEAAIEYQYLAQAGIAVELEPWTVLDTLRWSKVMAEGLAQNFRIELARAELIKRAGVLITQLIVPPYPYGKHPTITEPGTIDYAAGIAAEPWQVPAGVDYKRVGTRPVHEIDMNSIYSPIGHSSGVGSNSWVVSGELTDSGRPMLANDPHISIQMPAIWYEVGLHCTPVSAECPFDVVGVTFAGSPGVIIGHNQRIAWGFTNSGADVQDLYILTLNPDNPDQYLHNNEWVDFTVMRDIIQVANSEPIALEVRLSRWGPVISQAVGIEDQVLALRWPGLEGNTTFQGFLQLNKAQDWEAFRAAMRLLDSPSQNAIYADVDGNIGYQLPGKIPLRAEGHDGKLPVDGSNDTYTWQGYIPFDELPSLYNPDAGYIVTANNNIVGPDYPYPLIDVYSYGWRALRIETMIQNDPDGVITLNDMAAIQGDNYNQKADFLMPALQALETDDPVLQNAVAWLGQWDYQNHRDSPQAALFEAFWVELLNKTLDELSGAPAGGGDLEWYLMSQFVANANHPIWDIRATPDVKEDRDAILILALAASWTYMLENQGDDPAAWSWGKLHQANFQAVPLGSNNFTLALDAETMALFNISVAVSGGNSIVNATEWNSNHPFTVTSLPSMRQILSTADWDSSRRILTLGQGGDPHSPHYQDQLDMWANLEYREESFSREAVEARAETVWVLRPGE
jgi:penicillin amidase